MRRILYFLIVLLLSAGLAAVAAEKPVGGIEKYRVVINHEEQYSIWIVDSKLPAGWKPTSFVGSKQAALDHIEEVWTDMRPLSQRREMALQIYQKQKTKK